MKIGARSRKFPKVKRVLFTKKPLGYREALRWGVEIYGADILLSDYVCEDDHVLGEALGAWVAISEVFRKTFDEMLADLGLHGVASLESRIKEKT